MEWNEITTDLPLDVAIRRHLRYSLGQEWCDPSGRDLFMATSLAVRDRLVNRMLETAKRYDQANAKRLYYLSMEFLIGRSLSNNLDNLGLRESCQDLLLALGADLE